MSHVTWKQGNVSPQQRTFLLRSKNEDKLKDQQGLVIQSQKPPCEYKATKTKPPPEMATKDVHRANRDQVTPLSGLLHNMLSPEAAEST